MQQIKKKCSTKAERRFAEVLKELHIPFQHRWIIKGKEVDFLIGNTIFEIDGRKKQAEEKNRLMIENGYNLIHLDNLQTKQRSKLKKYLKLWQQTFLIQMTEH